MFCKDPMPVQRQGLCTCAGEVKPDLFNPKVLLSRGFGDAYEILGKIMQLHQSMYDHRWCPNMSAGGAITALDFQTLASAAEF